MTSVKLVILNLLIFSLVIAISEAAPRTDQYAVNKESYWNPSICKTKTCGESADLILNFIDSTVNPCENFYKFACGGYQQKFNLPAIGRSAVTMLDTHQGFIDEELKIILADKIYIDDPLAIKTMKKYYDSCLDTDKIEMIGENDLHEILKNLGGWPVLLGPSWSEKNFNLALLINKMYKMGFSAHYLFTLGVEKDLKNNSRHSITVNQRLPGLGSAIVIGGSETAYAPDYYNYMYEIAELLGINNTEATVELTELVNFELELVKLYRPPTNIQNRSELYNPMTITELETQYPNIPWTEYITEFLAPHAYLEPNEKILVGMPSYFENLSRLIERTPNRVLANYAIWRVIDESTKKMNNRMLDAKNAFSNSYNPGSKRASRDSECSYLVQDIFSVALNALFIRRKYMDNGLKTEVAEILDNIRNSTRKLISQVEWMDEEVKKQAIQKFDKMISMVAYPDELLDDEKINGYYEGLNLKYESLLHDSLQIKRFLAEKEIKSLREKANRHDWVDNSYIALVNAQYIPIKNAINIATGILQGIFYNEERQKYLNYGSLGWVLGHEIAHSFDPIGSQYDGEGNLNSIWGSGIRKNYTEKLQCFIDQYNNYTVEDIGLKIDGFKTLGENFADNAGIKEAYNAYKEWEEQNGVENQLPDLPYNPKQLFWISAAQTWCEKMEPGILKAWISREVHAPGMFRIIGTMSNMKEFSEDFKCRPGLPMNPVKKCTIW